MNRNIPESFSKARKLMKRKLLFLKIRAFLLIVLPIGIITVGHAVIKEYSRIKIRKLAGSIKSGPASDSADQKTDANPGPAAQTAPVLENPK